MGSVPTGWEIEVESLSRGRWASKNPREWDTEVNSDAPFGWVSGRFPLRCHLVDYIDTLLLATSPS